MLKNKAKEETREARATSLRALVEGEKAKQIFVADDIPKNASSIETVNIQTFEEECNIHYTESITTSLTKEEYPDFEEIERFRALEKGREDKRYAELAQEALDKATPDIGERLKNPLTDSFVVANMEKQVSGLGYGLFARKNIPYDIVLGIYAGELSLINPYNTNDDYVAALPSTKVASNVPKLSIAISAKGSRNLLGFAQHLPSEDDLKKWGFTPYEKDNIQPATENLTKLPIPLVGINFSTMTEKRRGYFQALRAFPFLYFRSRRNIEKNEIVGFSYGIGYWIARHTIPSFFDKKGQLIPKEKYLLNLLPLAKDLAKENEGENVSKIIWLLESFDEILWERRNYFDVSTHVNDLAIYYYQIALGREKKESKESADCFIHFFSLGEAFLLFHRYIAEYPEKDHRLQQSFLKKINGAIEKFFSENLNTSCQEKIDDYCYRTFFHKAGCEEPAGVQQLKELISRVQPRSLGNAFVFFPSNWDKKEDTPNSGKEEDTSENTNTDTMFNKA